MKTYQRIISFISSSKALHLTLILLVAGTALHAQDDSSKLTPEQRKELASMKGLTPVQRQRVITAMTEKLTPEQEKRRAAFDEMHKMFAVKDLDQRMDAVAKFVKDHPEFMSAGTDGPSNAAYATQPYIKANHDNSEKLRVKLTAIDDAFPSSASLGKSSYEFRIARFLLTNEAALDYAAVLAQSSIDAFHEDEFTADQQKTHAEHEEYESKHEKSYVPEAFDPGDADVHFHQDMSARYATLGSVEAKLGKNDAALQAFTQSLKFHPDMDAYLGMAKLEETKGDKAAALVSLEDAYLTGHLDAPGIAHMKQLYADLHPDSHEEALESLLDGKYKTTFNNPVKFAPYVAKNGRPDRTVLAELFTGAGCEPCMAPDLAFDATLQRYTRKEVVVLVDHDNAPFEDPLANDVTEERAKYYATGGSTPHGFLSGKEVNLVEGLPSHAQDAFDSLSKSIDGLLDAPAEAHLEVQAKRHGSKVQVIVQGTVASAQNPLLLHVDLVETEVSYSGENGLHLHPMVVRATAKQTESGSGFDESDRKKIKAKYTFNLQKIEAANLVYYSKFDVVLKKRTHGLFGAKYREQKTVIDPMKLAAVAFLQNDSTKNVLQAAFTPVAGEGSAVASQTQGAQ